MAKRNSRPIPQLDATQLLRVKRLSDRAQLPTRGTQFSAGLDLYACIDKPALLGSRAPTMVATGIAVEIPPGYVGLVRGRSGMSSNGIIVVEGTVDADYRGELMVLVRSEIGPYVVHHGDRIGQLVIVPSPLWAVVESDELSDTVRGANGYGSTGR